MPSNNKRDRADGPGEEGRTRQAKERKTELVVSRVEAQLCAGFSKLHSTKAILSQAKANLEMVGGLVCRQKVEIQQIISRLHDARRGAGNNVRLTVVAEAAHQKYEKAMHDQIKELALVEEALAQACAIIAEDNEQRNGPWPPLPPIRARPDQTQRNAS